MKTSKLIPALTIAIAIGAMIYTGCKKQDDTPAPSVSETGTSDRTISGINEMSVADASFNDALNFIAVGSLPELAKAEQNSINPWKSSCAVVTVDMNVRPHKAVIDFGSGCSGLDGNLRSGKILITWEGDYVAKGSYFIFSFDNYYLNKSKIEGNSKLVNGGYNRLGNLEFLYDAEGSITVPPREPQTTDPDLALRTAEIKMSYTFHGKREWVSGMWTSQWDDDVYMVSGYFFGTNLSNLSYKAEITRALRNEIGYPFYTSGVLNLRIGNEVKMNELKTIDYGYVNNERDDLATVTVGDVVTIIHLDKNPLMIANTR